MPVVCYHACVETIRALSSPAADAVVSQWTALALDLPRFHDPMTAGNACPLLNRLAELPPLDLPALSTLPDDGARLAALDVLMVDAFVRRHAPALDRAVAATLDAAVHAVAERMGTLPILSYPFYIRANPTALDQIRRFTPTDAEIRFIRMHRVIEDSFDRTIERLDGVLAAADRRTALAAALPALSNDFRLVNRVMAGLRSEERIPRETFTHGFRPYFDARFDPTTGELVYHGPSGLQSPTYRTIAMMVGYRDALLDDWTERIAPYHEPVTRAALQATRIARDAGRSLASVADELLGSSPELPHLHPDYGADIPALFDLARRRGYLSADGAQVLQAHDIRLGEWPDGVPVADRLPEASAALRPPVEADLADLACLAEIEAMLFGFHVEHVATTAVQIGHVLGTGGTTGVDFLLLATFRRAFPRLWRGQLEPGYEGLT